jgi:hypothetical protein
MSPPVNTLIHFRCRQRSPVDLPSNTMRIVGGRCQFGLPGGVFLAGQVGLLVTVGTLAGVFAITVTAALDVLSMQITVIPLEWHITRRVAVHAPAGA